MKLLLRIYPRRWRERYGGELLALLETEPRTLRVLADVVASGLRERLHVSGPPQLRVLWAWSVFVVGGVVFQKTAEHWQMVVPAADHTVPTVAFDVVQAAAAIGSGAVLVGVALALPAFVRDLRSGGWSTQRRPILLASAATVVAAAALLAVALDDDVVGASVLVVSVVVSLFAWTHAAAVAARRLPRLRAHAPLGLIVAAAMFVVTVAAAAWFAAVNAHAPSFVGAAQLAIIATFMVAGATLAVTGVGSPRA